MDPNGPRIHHLGETSQWPGPPVTQDDPPEVIEQAPTSKRTLAMAAGLLLAGVVVGALVVGAAQGASRTTARTPAAAVIGGQQDGAPQTDDGTAPDGAFPAAPRGGGFDGEQRLLVTITSVGSGSITVRTGDGTATYVVNAGTEIRRNGAAAQLSDLQPGDTALVHVYPSGGASVAERVLVGSSATDPGFGFGGGGGGQLGDRGSTTGTGTSRTT